MLFLVVALLAPPASAMALVPPVMDDGGSAGTTCRWNPFAVIECNGPSCWWVGRFEWHDGAGNPTGVICA